LLGSGGVALTNLQLYTFGLVTSIGIPCIIALIMMIKEFKIKNIFAIFVAPIIYGLLISSVVWRIISLIM
jgi:ferrous iron transport protein B